MIHFSKPQGAYIRQRTAKKLREALTVMRAYGVKPRTRNHVARCMAYMAPQLELI